MLVVSEGPQHFPSSRRLFIDSCVLVEWTKDPSVRVAMHGAQLAYSLAFSSISLLEVGFGPDVFVEAGERQMAYDIFTHENIVQCSAMQFALLDASGAVPPPGSVFSLNPGHEEWFMARRLLTAGMTHGLLTPRQAGILRHDALFYASAWNSRSMLITDNLRDFKMLGECHIKLNIGGGPLPFFSINDLRSSLHGAQICYPENVIRQL